MKTTAFRKNLLIGGIALFVGFFVFSTKGWADLDSGLVAYWSFDEGSGDTAHDYSGNGNDGTVYGAIWVDGISGKALSFDGNDYISVPHSDTLDITGDLTIATWVNLFSMPYVAPFVSKGTRSSNYSFYLGTGTAYSNKANFQLADVHGLGRSQQSLEPTNWYHVVAIREDTTRMFYINGALDTTCWGLPGAIRTNDLALHLGFYGSGPGYFHGIMDEVRLYNRALTEAEIESLYTEVGIEDKTAASDLPRVFSLNQNFPNPFNPTTQIKYSLPKGCYVRLEVYNILGRKVATLVDRKQKAGYKTARWDASSLSSGIYFYTLKAGDFVQTRKMALLK